MISYSTHFAGAHDRSQRPRLLEKRRAETRQRAVERPYMQAPFHVPYQNKHDFRDLYDEVQLARYDRYDRYGCMDCQRMAPLPRREDNGVDGYGIVVMQGADGIDRVLSTDPNRPIILNGMVDLKMYEDLVLQLMMSTYGGAERVTVVLTTMGGNSSYTQEIINAIDSTEQLTGAEVMVVASGKCMSAGFRILTSRPAHLRAATFGTSFMMHGPREEKTGWTVQTLRQLVVYTPELAERTTQLEAVHAWYISTIAKSLGLSDVEAERYFDGFDHYFTADEMLSKGWIAEILQPEGVELSPREEVLVC